MKLLQRARKCGPHARREDKPQRLFEPTSAGKLFPASRPKRLAALALLGFAICLPASAVATEMSRWMNSAIVCSKATISPNGSTPQKRLPSMASVPCHRFASCCGTVIPRYAEFAVVALVRIGPEAKQAVPQLTAILQVPQIPTRATAVLCAGTHWAGGNASRTGYPAASSTTLIGVSKYAINALASLGTRGGGAGLYGVAAKRRARPANRRAEGNPTVRSIRRDRLTGIAGVSRGGARHRPARRSVFDCGSLGRGGCG